MLTEFRETVEKQRTGERERVKNLTSGFSVLAQPAPRFRKAEKVGRSENHCTREADEHPGPIEFQRRARVVGGKEPENGAKPKVEALLVPCELIVMI